MSAAIEKIAAARAKLDAALIYIEIVERKRAAVPADTDAKAMIYTRALRAEIDIVRHMTDVIAEAAHV
jgi:hypothetical protein